MKFLEYLERIERVDQLIRLEATGTPKELANRLNISVSVLYDLLNLMKELGAPIYYSNTRQSYCYEEIVKFKFCFEKLSKDSLKSIKGGLIYNYFTHSEIIRVGDSTFALQYIVADIEKRKTSM